MTASTASLNDESGLSDGSSAPVGSPVATQGYQLSSEERDYDCKRLTGHLQIRILELRSQLTSDETSMLARSLNAVGTTAFGGSHYGLDPKSDRAQMVERMQAYNAELANKKCKSFDLAAAISSSDLPPSPTVAAATSQ